jgi:hypothetical protein
MVYRKHRLAISSDAEYSIPKLRVMIREVQGIVERGIAGNTGTGYVFRARRVGRLLVFLPLRDLSARQRRVNLWRNGLTGITLGRAGQAYPNATTASFQYNGDGLGVRVRGPDAAEEDYFPPEAGKPV